MDDHSERRSGVRAGSRAPGVRAGSRAPRVLLTLLIAAATSVLPSTGAAAVEREPRPSLECLSVADVADTDVTDVLPSLLCPDSPSGAPTLPYQGDPPRPVAARSHEGQSQPAVPERTGPTSAVDHGVATAAVALSAPVATTDTAVALVAADLPAPPRSGPPAGPGYRLICSLGGAAIAGLVMLLRGGRRLAQRWMGQAPGG